MTERNEDDRRWAQDPFRRDAETPEQLEAMVAWLDATDGSPAWVVGPAARRLARDVRTGRVPWLTREQLLRLLASHDPQVREAFASLEYVEVQAPDDVIWASPERHSGTPCFAGTRVPVQHLLGYLAERIPLDEFLADFPGVQRWQADAIMRSLDHKTSDASDG